MGTSARPSERSDISRDHPHACGEKLWCSLFIFAPQGSSPRVWGKALIRYSDKLFCGIIPTRVGTSIAVLSLTIPSRDHPHACGDKNYNGDLHISGTGSSPRVWGQALSCNTARPVRRIIPTRVGTSG